MPVPADPVRVLHFTDPHLFATADGSLRGRVTHATLQRVLEHYRQSGWSADHVQVTGDIVQDDTREAYVRFREAVKPLGLPVYSVPGNHDVRGTMREELEDEQFHYCSSIEVNNWLIAGIDSSIEGQAAGGLDPSELKRLDGLVNNAGAEHAMICLHHPPLPVGSKWLDVLALQNAEEFLERVTGSGKVRLVVFGHVHQAFDDVYRSVRIIGTPSTCRQFALGSDTFAVDEKPPAYRRIELYADGRVDTEVVWA
jgi:3',5'-cyclic-AMP phosphodiesterase